MKKVRKHCLKIQFGRFHSLLKLYPSDQTYVAIIIGFHYSLAVCCLKHWVWVCASVSANINNCAKENSDYLTRVVFLHVRIPRGAVIARDKGDHESLRKTRTVLIAHSKTTSQMHSLINGLQIQKELFIYYLYFYDVKFPRNKID